MTGLNKVVVTGGAGFIGANLSRHLVEAEIARSVVAFDNLSTGRADNLADLNGVELVEGDILDQSMLAEILDGAAAVVHLAARPSVPKSLEDPVATHDNNATGTLRVLEAARAARVQQVVVASSSSIYGANPTLPKVESLAPMPVSPYAASKLAAESYALAYQASFGIRAVAFRFFNVFGPLQRADHDYAAVVPAFLSSALAGAAVTINGDGLQTRDFTYVGTVCDVIADVVARGSSSPTPVNLAFGTRVSLLELIAMMEQILGHRIERHHVAPRAGDVRDSQADQSALRALVDGVDAVDLETGLGRTIDWFRSL